tara:strand:- start:87 stop:800 length:714 start_codon:yes stop_codon:yes gene_type:complete
MKIDKTKLREIIREVIAEGPFQHSKYSYYNKDAERLWRIGGMAKRKKWLKKAMPTVSRKFLTYNYDELTPMIRKKLYNAMNENVNEAGMDWKIKNKKVDAVLKRVIKSMNLKTVKDYGMGQSGISFFVDDEKEAKKLYTQLNKQMKNVKMINLDKSKGDKSNYVVYSRMFESKKVDEGFGSPELMKKSDLAEFEKKRQKNAEVLGYKLTGRADHNHERKIRTEMGNAGNTKKSKKTG